MHVMHDAVLPKDGLKTSHEPMRRQTHIVLLAGVQLLAVRRQPLLIDVVVLHAHACEAPPLPVRETEDCQLGCAGAPAKMQGHEGTRQYQAVAGFKRTTSSSVSPLTSMTSSDTQPQGIFCKVMSICRCARHGRSAQGPAGRAAEAGGLPSATTVVDDDRIQR
jgi:hypothetical protein